MLYFVLLFIEIIILFLLSREMSKTLSRFMSINFLSFIFSPGVIVHELAHFFMAIILFVPVGNIEFSPKKSGDGLKLGSIEIAKTDPVRRSLIGFAPVFVGLVIVVGMTYLFGANIPFFQNKNPYVFIAVILALIYLLFAVSNTMFSSSKDMEGAVEVFAALLIIFGAAYALGFRPSAADFNRIFIKEVLEIMQKSTFFLLAPILIDFLILGIVKLLKR